MSARTPPPITRSCRMTGWPQPPSTSRRFLKCCHAATGWAWKRPPGNRYDEIRIDCHCKLTVIATSTMRSVAQKAHRWWPAAYATDPVNPTTRSKVRCSRRCAAAHRAAVRHDTGSGGARCRCVGGVRGLPAHALHADLIEAGWPEIANTVADSIRPSPCAGRKPKRRKILTLRTSQYQSSRICCSVIFRTSVDQLRGPTTGAAA